MVLIRLACMLLTASQLTSGSNPILHKEPLTILYPKILSNETIRCPCVHIQCYSVYWFRSVAGQMQFIGSFDNADNPSYANEAYKAHFHFRRTSSSFALRIIKVTEADAGIYSCIMKDMRNTEVWNSGTILRPGVIPPTVPPPTKPKPPIQSVCHCSEDSQDGCSSWILWPMVGLIAAVALALVCTLYYFSRLPKKCRHRFVKRRLMS